MGFIDELKSEIKTYSEELKTYYDNDFTKAWEIVNESSCKESEFYNGTVAPISEERDNVRNALREIPNFRKTASRIYELKTEEAIRKHYNRLVEIRTAVQKAFPNGLKVGENENEVDVATELLKQRNEELSKYNFDNYDDLSGYMSESDIPYAVELSKYLGIFAKAILRSAKTSGGYIPIWGIFKGSCGKIPISDVRYFSNEWYDHILIRTAENETDYRGGFNNYTTLSDLEGTAAELLNDLPF